LFWTIKEQNFGDCFYKKDIHEKDEVTVYNVLIFNLKQK
jgi:hypothetical protein